MFLLLTIWIRAVVNLFLLFLTAIEGTSQFLANFITSK